MGEGQYLNPKHSLCILKKKRRKKKVKKNVTEPGFEPTTSGLEIHEAKHYYIAITKYE